MGADISEVIKTSGTAAEIEYATLREEVLKRLESRQQTLSIALTLAGAFLGLGWNAGSVVILMYPLIALLLAVGWAQNELTIKQLNVYIRDHLETKVSGLGWENYSRNQNAEIRLGGWPVDVLAISGIFVLTQIMAIGLGMYRFESSSIEWVLFIFDVAAVALMFVLAEVIRRRSVM